jgi:hypothetical protein
MTLPSKSRRSGGPKTAQGKLVSSRNAIKIGAYSSQIVLPGESEEEFRSLEKLFMDDLLPCGISEAALVHSLAVIVWKKLRLERLESRYVADLLDRLPMDEELSAVGIEGYPAAAAPWVNCPESIASLGVGDTQQAYWALHELKNNRFNDDALKSIAKHSPELMARLKKLMQEIGVEEDSPELMAGARYYLGAKTRPIEDAADSLMEQLQGEVWACQNAERLLEARRQIRDRRLLEFFETNRTQRASDDLDRAYTRTLGELRWQREWRRKEAQAESGISSAALPPKKKKA